MPSIRFATIGAVLLAFVVAAVVVGVAHALVRRTLEALDIVGAENREAVQARARQLTRALTLLAYGVAALAVLSLALNRLGVSEPQWDPRLLGRWFLTHGVNLVIIAAGAFIVVRAANLAIEHLRFKLARRHAPADLEWLRRAESRPRRHLGILSHPRRSGEDWRRGPHQRRRRHRGTDQPADHRPARRRGRRPGLSQRHDYRAR